MKKESCQLYGGQAVVEGVMFGGKQYSVTAIRRKDDSIEYYELPNNENNQVNLLKKIPFLRGIVALIQSSANGSRHLNFSTERYDVEPGEKNEEMSTSKVTMILGVAVVGVLSVIFGKMLFTALPAFLANLLFGKLVPDQFYNNLIEGGIKIIILLGYIYAISQAPFINRLFQYHGAEHKVINTFETDEELTVANVKKYSRFHYRCGSSFIILSVIIGVIIYSIYNEFIPYNNLWDRILQRITLIPVVVGVSYEALRFTNYLRNIPVLKWLGLPGVWLQYLTTKEPDDSQIEVSIAAFNRLRDLDNYTNQDKLLSC